LTVFVVSVLLSTSLSAAPVMPPMEHIGPHPHSYSDKKPRTVEEDERNSNQDTVWKVRQVLDDPAGDRDWILRAEVDLAASDAAGRAVLRVLDFDRLG